MYEDIKKMLNESNYIDAKNQIVALLNENDDPDLWYLLFLAENNNYLDFDPNNINNTYAYNQATKSSNDDYQLEFRLFKELALMGINKLFRLIQMGKYDEVDILLDIKNKFEFSLSRMSKSYLNDLIFVNDEVKIKYYLNFIEYVYENTNNDSVLEIKDRLVGYMHQKGLLDEDYKVYDDEYDNEEIEEEVVEDNLNTNSDLKNKFKNANPNKTTNNPQPSTNTRPTTYNYSTPVYNADKINKDLLGLNRGVVFKIIFNVLFIIYGLYMIKVYSFYPKIIMLAIIASIFGILAKSIKSFKLARIEDGLLLLTLFLMLTCGINVQFFILLIPYLFYMFSSKLNSGIMCYYRNQTQFVVYPYYIISFALMIAVFINVIEMANNYDYTYSTSLMIFSIYGITGMIHSFVFYLFTLKFKKKVFFFFQKVIALFLALFSIVLYFNTKINPMLSLALINILFFFVLNIRNSRTNRFIKNNGIGFYDTTKKCVFTTILYLIIITIYIVSLFYLFKI